jgi:hypothetical protein
MTSWKAAYAVTAFELRREWGGLVLTCLFSLYFGFIFTGLDIQSETSDGSARTMASLMNWVCLFGFPLFGSPMSRNSFHCWRDDPFTRRIAHWRTMPIPVPTIVRARYLQSIAIMIIFGGLFSALIYGFHDGIRDLAGPGEWIASTVVWIAYGLIVQIGYILLELGFNGKTYMKWHFAFTLGGFAVSALAGWYEVNVLIQLTRAVVDLPVPMVVGGLVLLAAALWIGSRLTVSRMRSRKYIL